jgi:hypothetical protein
MERWSTVTCCLALWLACPQASLGQERLALPDPAKGYQWQEEARKRRLHAADIDQLAQDKVLVTNEAYKQVFDPYVRSDLPLFITADSLLNGFHVLFEESIVGLERVNARVLPEILRFLWGNLATIDAQVTGDAKLTAAAKARAQIMVGVALRLLGDQTIKPDAKLADLIDAEVKRVVAAAGTGKPAWLGPPDAGFVALDYTRYRPRGFYTRSPELQRYFRAVAWLQSIPFRVANDEELLSILMLGNSISYYRFRGGNSAQGREYELFFHRFRRFLGVEDDWDLTTAAHQAQNKFDYKLERGDLAREREILQKAARGYDAAVKINDQLRFLPAEPGPTPEVSFRILSAYRLPDAVLFQRTTDPRVFSHRAAPTGLEVCAALGSTFARAKLTGPDRDKLLQVIDGSKPLFSGSSLYLDYLRCLAALLAEPEPDAPAFLGGQAWRIKSCQTVLAGWAQARHTWALQAKQTVHYLGLTEKPPGFVEPNPEFFARLARLVREAEESLQEAGALDADPRAVAEDIRAVVALMKKHDLAGKGEKAFADLSPEEIGLLERTAFLGAILEETPPGEGDKGKYFRELMDKTAKLADRIEKGEVLGDPKFRAVWKETGQDFAPLWRRLENLCRRLEALAHKQLRGVPFNEEERHFLVQYGESLAGIMLYGGNSYLTPRDDAPRVVDVFSNPNDQRYLEVGIARARALYVLYPVKGGDVLCRGAVLPYYEFLHPRRLTDGEWKTLLGSKARPDLPAWIKPLAGRDGITVPKLKEDH